MLVKVSMGDAARALEEIGRSGRARDDRNTAALAALTWGFCMVWACGVLERATRIELALSAWEADVLPLNYARGTVRA
ncbi:MAG: hypothetical protein QOG99_833 [Frankiales bacterium]|nr:hypothetical protein [Frankiales bacterium]